MFRDDIEEYNTFEEANTMRATLGAASTMQSIDQLLMRLETETRLRMASDGGMGAAGRCLSVRADPDPLPLPRQLNDTTPASQTKKGSPRFASGGKSQ